MKYEIVGEPYPAVVCHLQRGEQMKTERGSMVWMDPVMKMETNTGGGGIGKMFGRMLSGESMFQNVYTAEDDGLIAFGSCFPGQILPIQSNVNRERIPILCQRPTADTRRKQRRKEPNRQKPLHIHSPRIATT